MKHNKLKIHEVKDKGLSKRDYIELAMLVVACVFIASAVLAILVAALKIISEQI